MLRLVIYHRFYWINCAPDRSVFVGDRLSNCVNTIRRCNLFCDSTWITKSSISMMQQISVQATADLTICQSLRYSLVLG